ncbi:hypothetical protein C8J56DRAFT_890231 [Mycena floridula]|nr:hypothetical protein C8J56DRAFT_890231 [Mycena floridula]
MALRIDRLVLYLPTVYYIRPRLFIGLAKSTLPMEQKQNPFWDIRREARGRIAEGLLHCRENTAVRKRIALPLSGHRTKHLLAHDDSDLSMLTYLFFWCRGRDDEREEREGGAGRERDTTAINHWDTMSRRCLAADVDAEQGDGYTSSNIKAVTRSAGRPYYRIGISDDEIRSIGSPTRPIMNTMPGPQTQVTLSRESRYLSDLQNRWGRWIHDQLGKPLVAPAKGFRIPTMRITDPDRWIGNKELDKFEEHLQLTFRWMQLNGLGGKRCAPQRVAAFGYFLGGKALTWFNDNVDGVSRERRNWTLIEVVMGLYLRFIHETAVQDATDDFGSVKYNSSVDELYQDLTRHAGRMVYPPDPYTFRTRIMELLPSRIRDEVLRKSITAETSETKTIIAAAKAAETMFQVKVRYDKRHKTVTTEGNKATGITLRRPNPFFRRDDRIGPPVRSSTPAMRPVMYKPRFIPRPSAAPTGGANTGNVTLRRSDLSSVQCYKCQGIGHIASMPECPQYGKPKAEKLFASRPVVDDREINIENTPVDEKIDDEDRHERDQVQLRAMSPVDATPQEGEWIYSEYIEQYEDYHTDPRFGAMSLPQDPGEETSENHVRFDTMQLDHTNPHYDDNELDLSSEVYMGSARVTGQSESDLELDPPQLRMARPFLTCRESRCLVQMPKINGVEALTLFDTGCTTDSISPAFADVAKIRTEPLDEEVPLILGTAGSKSVINRGGYATFDFPGVENSEAYVDVINLDKYDATIGTPGMRRWGIVLDMENDMVWIRGKPWKALTEGEERRIMAVRRNTTRMSNEMKYPLVTGGKETSGSQDHRIQQ